MIAAYSGVLFTPQSKVLVQLLRRSICRRTAVQLVESCLAKQPDYPRPRQFHRPAEDIQIEKPSTRCVEALVSENQRLHAILERVFRSTSWRSTAPLRAAMRWLRNFGKQC
jgi:hypothetical protein